MATVTSRDLPTFALFPANNPRSAWRPFGYPIVLVVPHRRDQGGHPIPNTQPLSAKVAIEGAPAASLVAGQDHVGLIYPPNEIFHLDLELPALNTRLIPVDQLSFVKADGTIVTIADAQEGDKFLYTTASGVSDSLIWYPDADYYDLSDVLLTTEPLQPGHYKFTYTCQYFKRLLLDEGFKDPNGEEHVDLLCVDPTSVVIARLELELNHPGEVIAEFYRLTPTPYLTNATRALDSTVALYRPFTDALQDAMDEQNFLKSCNWVYNVQFKAIPYLAALLGWDVPYFPQSLDNLRRALLRKTVELQKLKGSRQAVVELMRLFGYDILINHLWYSADGLRFIGPGDLLPDQYADQQIGFKTVCQTDLLLSNYTTSGFGQLTIPLLFRPQNLSSQDRFQAGQDGANITVDAYLVQAGSPAHQVLNQVAAAIGADPIDYAAAVSTQPSQLGFLEATPIHEAVAGLDVVGYSQILIQGGVGTETLRAGLTPPLQTVGVSADADGNTVSLTFDGYLDLSKMVVFAFATYTRQKLMIPPSLEGLESNRFSIQILSNADGTTVPPDVATFLLDFIHRIKAFHSLLYKISLSNEQVEVYQVTDLGVGGDVIQRYNTDIGRQQVPPAIIPGLPTEVCGSADPLALGYKKSDLQYRHFVLGGLVSELAAYLALNGRSTDSNGVDLPVPPANPGKCQFTYLGQDRVTDPPTQQTQSIVAPDSLANSQSITSGVTDPHPATGAGLGEFEDDKTAPRASFCAPDGRTDYSWKGRVADELLHRLEVTSQEKYQNAPCGPLTMGDGIYWELPVRLPQEGTHLAAGWGQRLDQAVRIDPSPVTLYYDNRPFLEFLDAEHYIAILRPGLNIKKTNLHFPGCRFVTMNKLLVDYVSNVWTARPWDEQFSNCEEQVNGLNAKLVPYIDSAGVAGEVLVFDEAPFTLFGNGLEPDVSSLGNQVAPSYIAPQNVIHKVYSSLAVGNPAIELDTDVLVQGTGLLNITEPLFPSASPLGSQLVDFIDGYPALAGYQTFLGENLGGLWTIVLAALGYPPDGSAGGPFTILFFCGSGVRVEEGVRLDCGCLVSDEEMEGQQDEEAELEIHCASDQFIGPDGQLDFSGELLFTQSVLALQSRIGCDSSTLDGSIPSLFEMFSVPQI